MTRVEPWYDALAIPVGPLVLLIQLGTLFVRDRTTRWVVGLASFAAIVAMFLYVASLDVDEEGANIGAGVLLLWVLVSFALLAVGAGREAVTALRRRL